MDQSRGSRQVPLRGGGVVMEMRRLLERGAHFHDARTLTSYPPPNRGGANTQAEDSAILANRPIPGTSSMTAAFAYRATIVTLAEVSVPPTLGLPPLSGG